MKKTKDSIAAETKINDVATQISKLLQENGLGMQAVIQISVLPKESPIIMAGNSKEIILPGQEEIPPGVLEAITKPGDKIR